MSSRLNKSLSIINFVFFSVMVTVNALANALPINGINTGEVSAKYDNLFVPAGFTFSIWGLIYLSLFAFSIYQIVGAFSKPKPDGQNNTGLVNKKVDFFYVFSSIINSAWIFGWHYFQLGISVLLMLLLLISLIVIYNRLYAVKDKLDKKDKWFAFAPFSLYLGWISVATIANISALLISFSSKSSGTLATFLIEHQMVLASIMICIAAALGILFLFKRNDLIYPLVIIWATYGILSKRVDEMQNSSVYLIVIATCLTLLSLLVIGIVIKRLYTNKFYSKPS